MDRGMNKKRWGWGFVTACLVWAVLGATCQAQEDRMGLIEKELAEIKKDVTAIREMLTGAIQGQRPTEHEVNVGDRPMRGDPKAKVTLIEFSDFQCPFC